jgi:membrane-associated phospholipid phosphatase
MENVRKAVIEKCWQMTWLLMASVVAVTWVFYNGIDLAVARFAHHDLPSAFVEFVKHGDDIDDYLVIACTVLSLWFLMKKSYRLFFEAMFVPVSALTAGVLTNIFKLFFGRWRPRGFFEDGQYGFTFFAPVKYVLASFPSGHSSSIMAIMTALAVLMPRYNIPFFTAAAIIASFRVIVGAHYPSDVLAGLALGYLSAHWLRYWLIRYKLLSEESTFQDKIGQWFSF